jgi:hypothetical protein
VDIHKPKTWHGPREFFREYLIIVIGVATALAGEQAIEWMHHQTELRETREALREEIAENGSAVVQGLALDRCRSKIYDNYQDWANGGSRPPKSPPVGFPELKLSVWEMAKAGPLSRMPVEERLRYALIYYHIEILQKINERQGDIALELVRYTWRKQIDLDHDQAERVLELSTEAQGVIDTQEQLRVTFLNDDLHGLGISPKPFSESNRERLNEVCKAAGVPTPALSWPESPPSNAQLTKTK